MLNEIVVPFCGEFTDVVTQDLVLVEQHGVGDPKNVYPEEWALIASSVAKRQNEFASGRECARKALSKLGIHNFPVLRDHGRAPIWPEGVIGSITHTEKYCAVVVGYNHNISSVGIDAEIVGRIDKQLWPLLFTQSERDQLSCLTTSSQSLLATIFFSAKESYFKYQYPIAKQWVDFQDVTVRVEANSFSIHPNGQFNNDLTHGRYCYSLDTNIVKTIIVGIV